MDGLTFFKMLRIMNSLFSGAIINKIAVKDGSVYISIYIDKIYNFVFRASPQPPALITSDEFLGEVHGAVGNITGATVVKIYSKNYERAGVIEVEKRKPSGKLLQYKLILEPAGNYANFLILGEGDIILYSLSSRTIDPDRNIGAGAKYSPPRPNKKYSIDNLGDTKSSAELLGFYPITSKYADVIISNFATFEEGIESIKNSLFNDDNFYIDDKNKVIPFKISNPQRVISFNELKDYYKLKDDNAQISDDKLKTEIKKIYIKENKKNLILKNKLESEYIEAEKFNTLIDEANLIKNNLYKVKDAGEYIFENYADDKVESIKYIVNYGENLKEKSDKLFKKSARLKRSLPILKQRIDDINQMISSYDEQVYYIENIDNLQELKSLFAELKSSKIDNKKLTKNKKDDTIFNIIKCDGYTLYIGKNSISNHKLVTQFAIDSDTWFHARLTPSAHLILRLESGVKLTDEMIKTASAVVASTSKRYKDDKVDIDYTLRKYVTKPKSTPVGFVTYKNFATVTIKPISKQEYNRLIV